MTRTTEKPEPGSDWRLASFEGERREQLRRWSRLPLEDIVRAIEEMGDIAAEFEPLPNHPQSASLKRDLRQRVS
ncbi:MAG: hypothetical protein L0H29_04205 [Sinobacteraceae bacterium]|nr:hypothetical protein [Nevskiaceae bacterium]